MSNPPEQRSTPNKYAPKLAQRQQIILQWSQDFGIQLPGLIMKMDTALLWGRRNYVSAWRALHVLDVFL
uniref:Uncharacterized protein n=1 Tax=Bionectria ochroleuca TaxID=29856 RepID=A0A0B7K8X4_BIOOC